MSDMYIMAYDIHVRHLVKEFQYLISCVLTDY